MDADLREQVIRAAADQPSQIDRGLLAPIVSKLDDGNPRVRAAAIVAVGRMGDVRAASQLLDLTERTEPSPEGDGDAWRKADPGRVLSHLAVQALVDLKATDACLDSLGGPHQSGAIAALKRIHDVKTVDGLFRRLSGSYDRALRGEIWATLIRLYYREGDFTEDSPKWWGTRPDTTGPYYDRQKWSESDRIAEAVKVAIQEGDESLRAELAAQLKKHLVSLDGLATDRVSMEEAEKAIELRKVDSGNPNLIANLDYATAVQRVMAVESGDAARGQQLFRQQSCINCHSYANGQQPRGPHLVDIGKRYKKEELIESILQPGKKIAQGFDTWAFAMEDGQVHTGFVVLESAETVTLRDAKGVSKELLQDQIEERVKQEISMMPQGIVGNLTPEQLADLLAWLSSLH